MEGFEGRRIVEGVGWGVGREGEGEFGEFGEERCRVGYEREFPTSFAGDVV